MALDDELILDQLDEHWRDLAQIRSRLRKKGFMHTTSTRV